MEGDPQGPVLPSHSNSPVAPQYRVTVMFSIRPRIASESIRGMRPITAGGEDIPTDIDFPRAVLSPLMHCSERFVLEIPVKQLEGGRNQLPVKEGGVLKRRLSGEENEFTSAASTDA